MDQDDKRLFLLDAYALIFRSYFAFARNPRITSKGMDTSAIFGFTTTLLEVLEKENPTHIAVVFDTAAPTQRHEDYKEYKANRAETPEAIKIAVPYIQKILDGFRIPHFGIDGYEADDVIGTLAKKAEKEGYVTYMMTPDKDFGQLVTENIKMYRPGRQGNPAEVWGPKEVCDRFKIQRVEQVIDLLGMMGDSVDNIPGLPGVGEKTAQKLLAEYDSLEGVLEHADEIKGKLGEKIRDNAQQGVMSKQLATIITDVPVKFDEKDLTREEANMELIHQIFEDLEFRTLGKRVFQQGVGLTEAGKEKIEEGQQMDLFSTPSVSSNNDGEKSSAAPSANGYKTIENTDHLYQLINDPQGCKMLVKKLLGQKSVAWDTETTSLDAMEAELVGMSFSYQPGKAYYVNFPEKYEDQKDWLGFFSDFFGSEEIEKVGQNLKYDITVLEKYGMEVKGPLFDTMLAHYLIEPDMRHNMDVLAESYLGYRTVPIEDLIGKKGKNQGNMRDVDPTKVAEYAGEDADITLQLKNDFSPKLEETGVKKVFHEIEAPLIPVLADMEVEGVRLDKGSLSQLSDELARDIEKLEKTIYEDAGETFNVSSPKQLGDILFDKLKLVDKPKKTKTGQYSTSEDILEDLRDAHPIVSHILDYRQMVKLKSTYVDALPALINPRTGRIHTTFNQTVAATGRLSSTNPNLQNIPIRTERGREVRKAFIPRDEEHVLLAADYSQIELRIIAALSKDEAMMDAFRHGEDIHAATAAKVFGVPLDEVTREQRGNAKTVNFGIIYGVSAFGLSQQTNLSRTEAKEVIESYFKTYPGIKKYIDNQIKKAREQGYVETVMGRRRYLKDINSRNPVVRGHSERNAINAPIQGSAADIIKLAMIRIHDRLRKEGLQSKMVLQVHDELVFDARKDELDIIRPMIQEEMEGAVKLDVPLEVEIGEGNNWLEAH
ncbi:MAG: DNA polymerase I [Bacteroidota bacterium]|nr:DNA polymerase I [Bacteroidota bacterium]MDX5504806.1 DNA polymerase I [Bacteroidota bacterium]